MPANAINFKFVAQKKKQHLYRNKHTQTYFHEINLFIQFFFRLSFIFGDFSNGIVVAELWRFRSILHVLLFFFLRTTVTAEAEVVWNVRGWHNSWLKFNQSNRIEGSHVFQLRTTLNSPSNFLYIFWNRLCRTTSSQT